MFKLIVLPKIHLVYRNDANEIKPRSNLKMTDKHAAEYSRIACLGVINLHVMYELLIQQYSQKYQSPQQNCHLCLYR